MRKISFLKTIAAVTTTFLIVGCNQNVKPEIISTYHYDKLNKEFKDYKIRDIEMNNGVLSVYVSGTSYTPEYKTNEKVITNQDCSKKEYNSILNMDLPKCKKVYTTKYIVKDGHIYTDKFKKSYEGVQNTVFMIDYTITSIDKSGKEKKETFNYMVKTNEKGKAILDLKPLIFKKVKNPVKAEIKITTDVKKNKIFVVEMNKEDLKILNEIYKEKKDTKKIK